MIEKQDKILVCPACKYTPLNSIVEDGVIIYTCEDCGWQKLERNYFYLTSWDVEIRQALAPIDIIHSIFTDGDVVDFLKPRLQGVSHISHCQDMPDGYIFGEVNIAYQIYLRQMVVLATTYAELILKDFFRCLFIAQPLRMNPYLARDGSGKATIPLNTILQAGTKEELLLTLTEHASSLAVGGQLHKVVEKIIKECKLKLDKPITTDLREVVDLRNRIVHEGKKEELQLDCIHKSFGLLRYLLYVLGQAAVEYQIPYLDDCGLLLEFAN
ncbi:MAG TPA: hypothetical protein VHV83_09925 [Armatimonadota bacterium]|nr:hypothetical protein [Armatimonadota bacterium]